MSDDFVRVKIQAAKRFKKQKRYEEAEKELLEALETAQEHPDLKMHLGDIYYHLGRYRDAERLVKEALNKRPNNSYALYLSGLIAYKQDRPDKALEEFLAVLQVKPDHFFSRKMVVILLLKQQQWEEALTWVNRALQQNPEDAFLLTQLARIYRAKRQYRQAIEVLEKLQQREQDNPFVRRQLMEVKALSSGKSVDEITSEISSMLSLPSQQNRPELWQIQAENLRKAGKLAQAAQAYQQVLKMNPESDYVRKQLAFIYKKLGDWEKSEAFMTEVFLRNPADVYIRNSLYSIYKQYYSLWQWVQLLREALNRHPEQVNLYGIIKKYQSQLDALKDLKMSSGEMEEQFMKIEHRQIPLSGPWDHLQPLHNYLVKYVTMTHQVPSFQEFMTKAYSDKSVSRKIRKSWSQDEIQAAYQHWLFWIHFYLKSRELPDLEDAMFRASQDKEALPVVWILNKKEIYFTIVQSGKEYKKPVIQYRNGLLIRISWQFEWTGRAGHWSLASQDNLLEILSLLTHSQTQS